MKELLLISNLFLNILNSKCVLLRTMKQVVTAVRTECQALFKDFIIFLASTAKAAFNKNKNLFTSKLDLNMRKKLVKCYVWSIALYGAETWTLRATDQKRLESFKMWC